MRTFIAFIAATSCGVLSMVFAQAPYQDGRFGKNVYFIPVANTSGFSVEEGVIKAGKGSSWTFKRSDAGVTLQAKGAFHGWYLNYDHKGKDPRLVLVKDLGPGCYWNWQEIAVKNLGFRHHEITCVASPSVGPLRGFQIDVADGEIRLKDQASNRAAFTLRYDDYNDGK